MFRNFVLSVVLLVVILSLVAIGGGVDTLVNHTEKMQYLDYWVQQRQWEDQMTMGMLLIQSGFIAIAGLLLGLRNAEDEEGMLRYAGGSAVVAFVSWFALSLLISTLRLYYVYLPIFVIAAAVVGLFVFVSSISVVGTHAKAAFTNWRERRRNDELYRLREETRLLKSGKIKNLGSNNNIARKKIKTLCKRAWRLYFKEITARKC